MDKSVQINGSTLLKLETDGESLGHVPVSFQIVPRSVTVVSGEMSA
jgi:diacylglycerol kinase family enzyme